MSLRRLLKLKAEFDAFECEKQQIKLESQQLKFEMLQLRVDLLSFGRELKREAKIPFASSDQNQSHESNKVDFDLPPVFDDYGEERKEEVEEEEEIKEDTPDALEGTQDKIVVEVDLKDVSLGNNNLFTFDCCHLEPPQMKPMQYDLFVVYTEPFLKAPYHEYKPFKDWIIHEQYEPECPSLNHLVANSQTHSIRTKQALFAWLILFQPSSCHPTIFFLMFKPLTKKFCHKDKWKEPTLVL